MATDRDYERLLAFRTKLRRFDQWSRQAAAAQGLTHAQHQLLLAVRGHSEGDPTLGQLADYLLVKQNTASELVDRCVALGLVTRTRVDPDHRVVRIRLTEVGHGRLNELTAVHLAELRELGPLLEES